MGVQIRFLLTACATAGEKVFCDNNNAWLVVGPQHLRSSNTYGHIRQRVQNSHTAVQVSKAWFTTPWLAMTVENTLGVVLLCDRGHQTRIEKVALPPTQ
jgi:hypothetical protein